ncbi:endonuclease domain-containing protein [Ectothiorhodospira sp. 9905]|nr:endonuclease domain-containing protein [Ectothiorhodospira sp. 9905]MCG5520404.1 endonuclease domain-containing protein [Ectothiorhodospira sp. 9905]
MRGDGGQDAQSMGFSFAGSNTDDKECHSMDKSRLYRHAKELRQQSTDAENLLWYHLRGRRMWGLKFRRQKVIGPYIVDFVCIEAGLIIEADGGQHADRCLRDSERSAFLEQRGFEVLRFWNHEILLETECVLRQIWEVLDRRG